LQKSGQAQCREQADSYPRNNNQGDFSHHEPEHVTSLRAQSHAKTNTNLTFFQIASSLPK
jgi:hypothetical protein